MKKLSLLAVLVITALLFTGCGINQHPVQNYPAVTEVQLNKNNFRIVGEVYGYSRQVYVFGIGGLSKKSLEKNAIMDMYEKANLTGSQAIVNITSAISTSVAAYFYSSKRVVARGTIIEFIDEPNSAK